MSTNNFDEGFVCTNCGHWAKNPKKIVKGSLITEILLWIFFLFPGIIYSIWRMSSKTSGCPTCGKDTMVPASTPVGKKLSKKYKIHEENYPQNKTVIRLSQFALITLRHCAIRTRTKAIQAFLDRHATLAMTKVRNLWVNQTKNPKSTVWWVASIILILLGLGMTTSCVFYFFSGISLLPPVNNIIVRIFKKYPTELRVIVALTLFTSGLVIASQTF